jgi:hypothetical protein
LKKNSITYVRRFAEKARVFVTESWHLSIDTNAPTVNLIDTISSGQAKCPGFGYAYYGLMLLAGVPVTMESLEFDQDGSKISHMRVAVFDDTGNPETRYIIDPGSKEYGTAQPRDTLHTDATHTGERIVNLSDTDLVALHNFNVINEKPEMSTEQKQELIAQNLLLAPNNYRIVRNAYDEFKKMGLEDKAKIMWDRYRALYPYPDEALLQKTLTFERNVPGGDK